MVAESAVESDQRTPVLTALPAEADAILARITLDDRSAVVVDGRHYYIGSLGGKKVIVAMMGIGMVNATDTTEAALPHFTSQSGMLVRAVVFAGVAGGSGLGIRGMSDGPGDPLNLPGFPFSFVVFKRRASDNAAAITETFLQHWDDA